MVVCAAFVALLILPRRADAARVVRNVRVTKITRIEIVLTAGTAYQFRTTGTTADPVMHLVDSANSEVAQNDDWNPPDRNALVEYTPTTGGTFYIIVRSWSSSSEGNVGVEYCSGACGSWSVLESSTFAGGTIEAIENDQHEYWTVMVNAALSGTADTVLYGLDGPAGACSIFGICVWPKITRFNDDSGVGRMSMFLRNGATVRGLLVGTYYDEGVKYVDLIANDRYPDQDGDALGQLLEAELGSCDTSTTSPGCASVYAGSYTPPPGLPAAQYYRDSDHDGLSDFHEVFGVDQDDWMDALHLPAWGADPRKKDVFLEQDWFDRPNCTEPGGYCWPAGVTTNPFTEALAIKAQSKYSVAPADDIRNLGGLDGVALHFDVAVSGNPCPTLPKLCGAWGKGGQKITVSRILHPSRIGVFRHFTAYPPPGGGGAYLANSWVEARIFDWIGGAPSWQARTLVHELGHSVGLQHGGHVDWGQDFEGLNCKPHYNSLMNYAYDINYAVPSQFDTLFNFSYGATLPPPASAVMDPRRVSELSSFGGLDASRLRWGATHETGHRFPRADAAGKVDWNRDDRDFTLPDEGYVRGTLPFGHDACKYHARVSDAVAPFSGVALKSPDAATFGSRLYAFFVTASETQVGYRSIVHTGPNDKAGCENGTAGADVTSTCHDFWTKTTYSLNVAPPGSGVISTVAALPWKGKMVVAHRVTGGPDDRKVFVSVAGPPDASGSLTFTTASTPITSDSDSDDIELSPMYVSTTHGHGYADTEVLAIFYTTGTGASAAHKMRVTGTPSDPLAAWSAARDVRIDDAAPGSGTLVLGGIAPGVTVWPTRSATGYSLGSDATIGQACGVFPGVAPSHLVKFLCYDKASDQWTDLTSSSGIAGDSNLGGRPGIAYHTLRAASPPGSAPETVVSPLGDGTRGQFILNVKYEYVGGGGDIPRVYVSSAVGSGAAPGAGFKLIPVENSFPQTSARAFSLYEDRDLSAMKAIGLRLAGAPPVTELRLFGIVDGAFNVQAKAGNDFHVMEHGICRGLHSYSDDGIGRNGNAVCGAKGYWGHGY